MFFDSRLKKRVDQIPEVVEKVGPLAQVFSVLFDNRSVAIDLNYSKVAPRLFAVLADFEVIEVL